MGHLKKAWKYWVATIPFKPGFFATVRIWTTNLDKKKSIESQFESNFSWNIGLSRLNHLSLVNKAFMANQINIEPQTLEENCDKARDINFYSFFLLTPFHFLSFLRYGNTWGTKHGGTGGQFYSQVLSSKEVIIGVKLSYDTRINSIAFTTNLGRLIGSFGSIKGKVVSTKHNGCALAYINGWFSSLGLDGMQFLFTC